MIAAGAALVATAAVGSLVFARSGHSQATDTSPFPVGLAFTQPEWASVKARLTQQGFDPSTLRVVSGMRTQSPSGPLALIRARSRSRGLCFVGVRGVQPGSATCSLSGRLQKPLLVFATADRMSDGHKMTDIVGVARHAIVGVSMIDHRGFESGVALVPSVGGLWSVTGGYSDPKIVVRARLASGHIAAELKLP